MAAVCWTALALLLWATPLRVSRRACNLCYVLWSLALNSGALAACMWLQPPPRPALLDALSKQQLAVFLVANLLTGAVNMSVNTLAVGDAVARAVVAAYGATVAGIALWMHGRHSAVYMESH